MSSYIDSFNELEREVLNFGDSQIGRNTSPAEYEYSTQLLLKLDSDANLSRKRKKVLVFLLQQIAPDRTEVHRGSAASDEQQTCEVRCGNCGNAEFEDPGELTVGLCGHQLCSVCLQHLAACPLCPAQAKRCMQCCSTANVGQGTYGHFICRLCYEMR